MKSVNGLTISDYASLRGQLAVVNRILEEHYKSGPQLSQGLSDLELLQAILDDGVLQSTQTYELQCLGVALGEVFVRYLNMTWVMVEDVGIRIPALKHNETSLIIYPLTMISWRVEIGEDFDVHKLFYSTNRALELSKATHTELEGLPRSNKPI